MADNCFNIFSDIENGEYSDKFKEEYSKFKAKENASEAAMQEDLLKFTEDFTNKYFNERTENIIANTVARDTLKNDILGKIKANPKLSHTKALLNYIRKGNQNEKDANRSMEYTFDAARKAGPVPFETDLLNLVQEGKISKDTYKAFKNVKYSEELLDFNADIKRAMAGLTRKGNEYILADGAVIKNKEAVHIARALKKNLEDSVERKRQVGIKEALREDYSGPQTHDGRLISAVEYEQFRSDMNGWLDPEFHKDLFETPDAMLELKSKLGSPDFIQTRDRKPSITERMDETDKFTRERTLHFKDLESSIAYDKKYGRRGTVVNHATELLSKFESDILARTTLGANPDATILHLASWAFKEDVRNNKIKANNKKISSQIISQADKALGKTEYVAHEGIAKIGSTTRFTESIWKLGKIVVNSILGGDMAQASYQKGFREGSYGPWFTLMKDLPAIAAKAPFRFVKSFAPLKDAQIVGSMKYTSVALRNVSNRLMREQAENFASDWVSRGWANNIFEFTSRMSKYTNISERAVAAEILAYRYDILKKPYSELTALEKTNLQTIGLDESTFKLLSEVNTNHNGQEFMSVQVYDIPDEKIIKHYKGEYDRLSEKYDSRIDGLEAKKKELEQKAKERKVLEQAKDEIGNVPEENLGADFSDAMQHLDDEIFRIGTLKKEAQGNFVFGKKNKLEKDLDGSLISQIGSTLGYRSQRSEDYFSINLEGGDWKTQSLSEIVKFAKQFKTFGISQMYNVLERTLTHPDFNALGKFTNIAALAVIGGLGHQVKTWTQEWVAGKELSEFKMLDAIMGSGILGLPQDIVNMLFQGFFDESGAPAGTRLLKWGVGPFIGHMVQLLDTINQQLKKEGEVNSAVVFNAMKGAIPGGNSIPLEFILTEAVRAMVDDYDYYQEKSMKSGKQTNLEGDQRSMRPRIFE